MMHGESIYNIIPPKQVEVEKPPMHKSKFPGTLPPTASTFHTKSTTNPAVSNIAGNLTDKPVKDNSHSGFGKAPGSYANDATNFMKKHEKTGERVLTLKEMKREHPEALAPKELKPQLRSGPPKADEKPVMNLVTTKNFVVANAVEVILAAPKKLPEATKDYMKKEDYGKVPKYLKQIKQDIDAEYAYITQLQHQQEEADRQQLRPLSDEERQNLLDGLKEKWEKVNTSYQAGTHITKLDTMGKIKRKEKNEAELAQIEKDIERLSKKTILVQADQ
jgi:hypothetical protein